MAGMTVREMGTPPQDRLMMIQQNYAVDVTLDYYAANSRLKVSADRKRLTFWKVAFPWFNYLYGKGFKNHPFVLGKEGFSSGSVYYEVEVSRSEGWVLGVAKESIPKDINFICPEAGVWAVHMYISKGEAYLNNISFQQYLIQRPEKVGVFVDYEKGEVSFYDVGARTLIRSYTGCTFKETRPSVFHFLTGGSSSTSPKLYPFFGLLTPVDDPNNMLRITPVAYT